MNERRFEPDEPGRSVPAPQHRGRIAENEERRLTGPQAAPKDNIEKAFDGTEDTGKRQLWQAYPIRKVKQRYGLPRAYAAFVAAEFRWRAP